mmetsp:Transcript_14120/g.38707  ORF Transcript_14120/g.38707 Transcript_14120/m.38707 type:complete len:344 (-) Transcript_14120:616-1647(-)
MERRPTSGLPPGNCPIRPSASVLDSGCNLRRNAKILSGRGVLNLQLLPWCALVGVVRGVAVCCARGPRGALADVRRWRWFPRRRRGRAAGCLRSRHNRPCWEKLRRAGVEGETLLRGSRHDASRLRAGGRTLPLLDFASQRLRASPAALRGVLHYQGLQHARGLRAVAAELRRPNPKQLASGNALLVTSIAAAHADQLPQLAGHEFLSLRFRAVLLAFSGDLNGVADPPAPLRVPPQHVRHGRRRSCACGADSCRKGNSTALGVVVVGILGIAGWLLDFQAPLVRQPLGVNRRLVLAASPAAIWRARFAADVAERPARATQFRERRLQLLDQQSRVHVVLLQA